MKCICELFSEISVKMCDKNIDREELMDRVRDALEFYNMNENMLQELYNDNIWDDRDFATIFREIKIILRIYVEYLFENYVETIDRNLETLSILINYKTSCRNSRSCNLVVLKNDAINLIVKNYVAMTKIYAHKLKKYVDINLINDKTKNIIIGKLIVENEKMHQDLYGNS